MKRVTYYTLILLMILLVLVQPALAQDETPDRPLRVVTKVFPPFVMEQDGQFTGFSIQLWESIAHEAGFEYELYAVDSVSEQLEAIQNGDADIAVAGISITAEREEVMDFSFPYFDAGLQILTRVEEVNPISQTLAAIFAPEFLTFLLAVMVLILIFAHVLWAFERRSNEYTGPYYRGIGAAVWWSAVTLIGFDDKPPATFAGRAMGLVWMFAGIFIFANLTATLSAGATVRVLRGAIDDVSDLREHRVATVSNTTTSNYLYENGISFTGVPTIEDAYAMLRAGQVEAVVFDAPVLWYYVRTQNDDRFHVVGQMFEPEKYGIALPSGSEYRKPINQAILYVQEDGIYDEIYMRWFGNN